MGVLGTERRRRRWRRRGARASAGAADESLAIQTCQTAGPAPWMPQQQDHAAQSASPAPCRDRSAPVRPSARPPVRPLVRRPPVRRVPRQRNIQKDHFAVGRPWVPQQRDHAAQSASPLRAATAVHPSVRQLVRPSARPPARPLVRRPPVVSCAPAPRSPSVSVNLKKIIITKIWQKTEVI